MTAINPSRFCLGLALLLMLCYGLAARAESLSGTVLHIDDEYGNVNTSFTPDQIDALGIRQGETFTVSHDGVSASVFLGETYGDVPRGEWIAFFHDGDQLRIARNFDNAAAALGVAVDDEITITR